MLHSESANESALKLSDRYTTVAGAEIAEARAAIERLQGSFLVRPRTTVGGASGVWSLHVRAATCGQVGISTFKFGRTVDIVPQGLAGSILVTTGIAGRAGLLSKRGAHAIACGATFITHEEDAPTFNYEPDTEVLKLRFDRQRFEDFRAKLGDAAPARPLRFDNLMAAPDAALRWSCLLSFVVATINACAIPSPSEQARLEEMLMLTLLNIQPGSHQADSFDAVIKVSPRQFRQAVDFIHQHLDTELRLSDIAAAAACSIRSLTRAFQLASDTTPMQYVHSQRLQRVRRELGAGASEQRTIADIAYHWGFRHLGEFNRRYRDTFGETPTGTRQRSRAS